LTTAGQGIGGSESKEDDMEGRDTICLNWESANLNIYYDLTRMAFEPILLLINVLVAERDANKIQKADMHIAINYFYLKKTALLNKISLETVPVFCNKGRVLKFW